MTDKTCEFCKNKINPESRARMFCGKIMEREKLNLEVI